MIVDPVAPAQEQAEEYRTVPEQALAYVGTLLGDTVTALRLAFTPAPAVVVVVVVVAKDAVVDVVKVAVLVMVLSCVSLNTSLS